MKQPRLIPVVEITTKPPNKKRQVSASSPLATQPPSPPSKKRRWHEFDTEFSDNVLNIGLPHSPTVSDFEVQTNSGNGLLSSPTVSDFAVPDSSIVDLTSESYEDEASVNPISPPTPPPNLPVASGSDVKQEMMPEPYTYEVMDDEILEDNELVIPGENNLDCSVGEPDKIQDEVPVRLLSDFTIYDMATNIIVPVAELLTLSCGVLGRGNYGASGIAKAWTDTEDGEEEEDLDDEDENELSGVPVSAMGERVKLSEILTFDTHHYSEGAKSLDSKMYIRTEHAWYILDTPSGEYQPFFLRFWIQHRALHVLATSAMDTPRLTYEDFLQSLQLSTDTPNEMAHLTFNFLGRDLTHSDIEADDVKSYVVATLPEICAQNKIRILRVPAIKTYLGSTELIDDADYSPSPRKSKPKAISRRNQRLKDKEKHVLKHRTQTVITPIVQQIAKELFKGNLEVAGCLTFNETDVNVAAEIDNIQAHHSDPKSMKWGEDAPEGGKYYTSIIMDGVEYFVGDDVMVNPGNDEDAVRARNAQSDASQSVNTYANRLWFCRICYFYEDLVKGKTVKMFHGQWFVHGSKTILQETAHSKALYLINKCESNPTASIFKKCKITMMSPDDAEAVDDGKPDANDFHCSMMYNEDKVEFVNLPGQDKIEELFSLLEPYQPCISCGMEAREKQQEFRSIDDDCSFTQYGIKYHRSDFIYILPRENIGVLEIAQIVKIQARTSLITVRPFGRHDDFQEESKKPGDTSASTSDERRLYRLDTPKDILPDQVDGMCYVRQLAEAGEIDDWVQHDDHFYVDLEQDDDGSLTEMDADALAYCTACYDERETRLSRKEKLITQNGPLIGLELFSGAGGLGTGMDMSGFIETRYAVEFSPSAAATYRTNHPRTTVYCQDSSLLLKHATESAAGKRPRPLLSNDGESHCPPLPAKGKIDIIYGGPPCQSFSRANHSRRADDIRSTLPGNMLSYVEHYNPKYFLLENVAGLLDYPLLSTNNGRSLEGGVKSGVVKFIMRTLIALGYQVRYNLLQAGQYGAPQSRRRVIFLGAKRGLKLPAHPVPMYAFPRGMHRTALPTGGFLQPVSRSSIAEEPHQCAPLRPITVNDAIGDLAPFDWINPHVVIKAKPRDKAEAARRENLGIARFDAVLDRSAENDLPGFPAGVAYATEPRNRYQKWLRQKKGRDDKVDGHYTKRFGSRIVEATTIIPMKALADHRDLPLVLQPNHAKRGGGANGQGEKKALYGRMDGDGLFKCAMTSLAPNLKRTWVLHPSQKRIITVRECARAQGFPDHYVFESADSNPQKMVDNQVRQIGNAVPVPMALALGKAIGEALLEDLENNPRDGSPEV